MSTLEAFYKLYKKEIEWEKFGNLHMAPLDLPNVQNRDSFLMKLGPNLEGNRTLCEDPIKLRVLQGKVRYLIETDVKNELNETIRVRRKEGEIKVGDELRIKRGQHYGLTNLDEAGDTIIFCDIFN